MSVKNTFAQNLRVLCEGETSISAACRGMGVNRQQFSRYLAGTALPNGKNLELICTYFGVSEASLFRGNDLAEAGSRATVVHRNIDALISRERPANLAAGLYFTDFAVPDAPDTIVRSVTIINQDGPVTTFRRLTNFAEREGSWWARLRGDHTGVVVERRSSFYMVGTDARGSVTPSMLVLKWALTEEPMLVGHASLIGTAGPMVLPIVMSQCRRHLSLRAALRQSRAHSTDEPTIDTAIQDALDQQSRELVGMTRKLDLGIRGIVSDRVVAAK